MGLGCSSAVLPLSQRIGTGIGQVATALAPHTKLVAFHKYPTHLTTLFPSTMLYNRSVLHDLYPLGIYPLPHSFKSLRQRLFKFTTSPCCLTDNSSACHNVKEELLTTILYSLRKLRLTVLTPVLLILDIMPFSAKHCPTARRCCLFI